VAIPARRIAACAGAADAEPPHPAPPSGDPVLPARTAVKGRGRAMRRLAYGVLAVAAALALLGVVLYAAGARQTVATLARLSGPELVVLVVTAFVVTLFSALAWQAILERDGHALSLWLLFRLTVVAFAVGWAIPSGFVAGMLAAAYFLRRRGVPLARGIASFVIGRFFEITGFALILPAILLSSLGSHATIRGLAAGTLLAVGLVYLDLILGWRLVRRSLVRLRRLLPGFSRPSLDSALEFCGAVADFFRAPLPRILRVARYACLAVSVAFLRSLLSARFLGLHLTMPELVVMFLVTAFLISVPLLPGAIGVYEGGLAGAFEALGHSPADGVAYAMTIHAAELVVVAVGFLFLGHLGIDLAAPRKAAAEGARGPLTAPRQGAGRASPRPRC